MDAGDWERVWHGEPKTDLERIRDDVRMVRHITVFRFVVACLGWALLIWIAVERLD